MNNLKTALTCYNFRIIGNRVIDRNDDLVIKLPKRTKTQIKALRKVEKRVWDIINYGNQDIMQLQDDMNGNSHYHRAEEKWRFLYMLLEKTPEFIEFCKQEERVLPYTFGDVWA